MVEVLHQRASDWFADNDEPSDAIRHAIAGHHFAKAAELVELTVPTMLRDRREAVLRGWIELLPQELLRDRPVLSNAYAAVLLSTGTIEGVDHHLREAERWLDGPQKTGGESRLPSDQMVVVDEEEFRRLPAGTAVHRAGLALVQGDLPRAVTHAQRALDLFDEDDHVGRGAATALIGLASWTSGDLEAAHAAYTECTTRMQRAGHLSDVLACSITLADIRITQGRLRDAMRTYEHALHIAQGHGGPVLRGTPDMYVGMAALHREHNDLGLASQLLARAEELGEHMGLPQNRHRWRIAMARVRVAEGDLDTALELLDEADRMYTPDFSPPVRPIPAIRARVLVAQGNGGEAVSWVHERGLSAADDLSYLQEFEHITLVRVLLAQRAGVPPRASPRRGRPAARTSPPGRRARGPDRQRHRDPGAAGTRPADAQGDGSGAPWPLWDELCRWQSRKATLRVFVDEGPAMASLLDGPGPTRDRVRPTCDDSGWLSAEPRGGDPPNAQSLVDPLSQRELDVLRLLGTDLGDPNIARELVLSLNTVRTHTKSIYAKLGVNNRRAAVRRGR